MTQIQKLVTLIVLFLVVLLGLSFLLTYLGATYQAVAFFKRGLLPYLVAFCITVFTVIPLGDKWMRKE